MKKISTLLTLSVFIFLLAPKVASGQMQATLLDNWHDDNLVQVSWLYGSYDDVWGIAINGGEYAIIGSTAGMHIVDVTDPTNINELFRIAGAATGPSIAHRDMKTYNGYLYFVADEGSSSTLQIVDLNDLPNSAPQVYSSNEFVITAHNIFIDEPNARLYILGDGPGCRVLDISTPDQPVLLADNNSTPVPYCHDGYIRDNIAYLNCGNQGFYVVDYTDPVNHVILGTMTNYPQAGYNHSGWLSDDGHYYYLLDETHATSVKTVDVSDFSNMSVVALFSPDKWPNEIAHNAILRGDRLYVSYYYDGLQVWDVSDPLAPELIAYHDTYCEPNETFYAGMWGVYPLLPSGNILGSDIQTGLYVFEALPETILDLSMAAGETPLEICKGGSTSFELALGEDFSTSGINLSGDAPAGVSVSFSSNPAQPGETVMATVTLDAAATGPFSMEIFADDNAFGASLCFYFEVDVSSSASNLQVPANDDLVHVDTAFFNWQDVLSSDGYELQISDNSADFENGLLFSKVVPSSVYQLDLAEVDVCLLGDAPYHWRVITRFDCGEVSSEVRMFDFTAGPNATGELSGNALNVFPSPVDDLLFVKFEQAVGENLQVELTSLTGQVLSQNDFAAGENTLTIDVSTFAAGMYLLRITDGTASHVQRIVVQ